MTDSADTMDRVPRSRIINLGDGDTDIPSMKMVRHQGGHSVAVFDPKRCAKQELQSKSTT